MQPTLREVTLEFSRGEASLGTLRGAAHAERIHRPLADEILKLIADWENSPWGDNARSRNELRARAKQLVPAAPAAAKKPVDAAAAMYGAGLRGQRRS